MNETDPGSHFAKRSVAFIRHGDYLQQPDTPSALQPYPLTSRGVEQAEQGADLVADYLCQSGQSLHPVVYTSPLLRAWQTADVMVRKLQESLGVTLSLQSEHDLVERSVGSLANLTLAQIEAVLEQDPRFDSPAPGWKANSDYRLPYPGAESLMDAGKRVAALTQSLVASSEPESLLLLIGHGAAFRHAAHVMGCLPRSKIDIYSMYHAKPVYFHLSAPAATPLNLPMEDLCWNHDEQLWKVRSEGELTND